MNKERIHTKPRNYFKDSAPEWMSDEALNILMKGYLQADETPNEMYGRLAKAAAHYYPDGIENTTQVGLETLFFEILIKGMFSPATPVASNFGAKTKALPVSCAGLEVANSVSGIFNTAKEAALLSKHGSGLGINLSKLIGRSPVTDWARLYDLVAETVSQNSTRRGAVALYLEVSHPNILEFLNMKEMLEGDVRSKVECNIGVVIDDSFMERLNKDEKSAKVIWAKILTLRIKYGNPYIQFSDNCQRQAPDMYKKLGLPIGASQLCSEIFQFQDPLHTYTCVLSSINVARYREIQKFDKANEYTVNELALFFLDAVNEEFVMKASGLEGFENSLRSAFKGRALGLGVLGLHSLYQSEMLPFESEEAYALNEHIFKEQQAQTERASRILAKQFGECEWTKGFGLRNVVTMAVAPTTTNSVLCNAGSPGIEPIIANYYVMKGSAVNTERKNKYLEAVLKAHGRDSGSVWGSIRENKGSVQHLGFLSQLERDVFKKAEEINQNAIIEQAADRQKYIDQGQSLNLFLKPNDDALYISNLHKKAWELGLKSLYYVRSKSVLQDVNGTNGVDFVYIRTRPDCPYCVRAKELLTSKGISYQEDFKLEGRVPEIYIAGEKLSNGYESLKKRFFDAEEDEQPTSDCVACEG